MRKPSKYTLFARARREYLLGRKGSKPAPAAPLAPPVVKPIVLPETNADVIAKPVIMPSATGPKPSGPKPEQRVDHRKPYTKKRGEYLCEVCGKTLKTEEGMIRHVEAKHPEVEL